MYCCIKVTNLMSIVVETKLTMPVVWKRVTSLYHVCTERR